MRRIIWRTTALGLAAVIAVFGAAGCGLMAPAKKPGPGPAGAPVESKADPPWSERFAPPPAQMYDVEATAGMLFEGINGEKWAQADQALWNIQTLWEQLRPGVEGKKGAKEADEALSRLSAAVAARKITASYESLGQLMAAMSDIAKSHKISPLSDIVSVGSGVRNVAFFVSDRNWTKAAAKAKELESTWQQAKPGMEQMGILGEVTRTHTLIKQLKDAVEAENGGAVKGHLANLNESIGAIRQFYQGK